MPRCIPSRAYPSSRNRPAVLLIPLWLPYRCHNKSPLGLPAKVLDESSNGGRGSSRSLPLPFRATMPDWLRPDLYGRSIAGRARCACRRRDKGWTNLSVSSLQGRSFQQKQELPLNEYLVHS